TSGFNPVSQCEKRKQASPSLSRLSTNDRAGFDVAVDFWPTVCGGVCAVVSPSFWWAGRYRLSAMLGPAAMSTRPSKTLETFPNPAPARDYVIKFDCPEFTCLCPKTGQPDFATIRIEYVPDALCVELKSWKLYLWSYRDEGAFHEAVTN